MRRICAVMRRCLAVLLVAVVSCLLNRYYVVDPSLYDDLAIYDTTIERCSGAVQGGVVSGMSLPASPQSWYLCLDPPLCNSPRRSWYGVLRCQTHKQPLPVTSRAYYDYVQERAWHVGAYQVKGWPAQDAVWQLVLQRLRQPVSYPLVLHFAGDNGVGKTSMAEAVSLALGQRCGNEACTLGESTLELSGSSFDGLSLEHFRRVVVALLVRHARRFPLHGVVIVNEFAALAPEKVKVLQPLLGRGRSFPEHNDVDLSHFIVVLTTDFGQEGRTQGKSIMEMRQFITREFRTIYGSHASLFVHTFPFMPISLDTAEAIVRMTVQNIGCRLAQQAVREQEGCTRCPRAALNISEDAVAWLLEQVKPQLSTENGRAVVQLVESVVEPVATTMPCVSADAAQHPTYGVTGDANGSASRSGGSCNDGSVYIVDVDADAQLFVRSSSSLLSF